ncbi:unnamed protein product, partial [Heterobilharzia americana]
MVKDFPSVSHCSLTPQTDMTSYMYDKLFSPLSIENNVNTDGQKKKKIVTFLLMSDDMD